MAASIAAEFAVMSKLASRKNSAGPSAPGRGSRAETNDGAPLKLPNPSGVDERAAGSKPPPTLNVSSAGLESLGPLPMNMLPRSASLLGALAATADPFRAADWSWFSKKMLLATSANNGDDGVTMAIT